MREDCVILHVAKRKAEEDENKQHYQNCINIKDSDSPTPDDVERVSKANADSDQTNTIREECGVNNDTGDDLEKETEIAGQQPGRPNEELQTFVIKIENKIFCGTGGDVIIETELSFTWL